MQELSVKDLLEAGCHFGHQTFRWNPKMKPFIFGEKNGIHIIDLDQTVSQARTAYKFIADLVALGNSVLFVGTKRQASDLIREQAERVNMHYVNQRWLGGMLTNFKTIKQSIDRLQTLYQRRDAGDFAKLPKKEALGLEREIVKFEKSMGGIKTMTKLPGAVFIIDPKTENIAQREANRLSIPVVAVTDTNCDPGGIDYLIPANDDAIRSINTLIAFIAGACEEGLSRRAAAMREEAVKETAEVKGVEAKEAVGRVREKKVTQKARAYTAEPGPATARRGRGRRGEKPREGLAPLRGEKPVKEKEEKKEEEKKKTEEKTRTL